MAGEDVADPVDDGAHASRPAQIAMDDDPVIGGELRHRIGGALEERVAVAGEARQQPDADAGAYRFDPHRQIGSAQNHTPARIADLLVEPARADVMGLLFGIGDPRRAALGAADGLAAVAAAIKRAGDGADLCDDQIAGLGYAVAQRQIGVAAREVRGLRRLDELEDDPRRQTVLPRAAAMAGEQALGPFPDRNADRAAQRRRAGDAAPFKRQRRAFEPLGGSDQGLAGGVEAQTVGQAVEQCRTTERLFECREPPTDRGLAQAERPAGRAQRPVTGNSEKHASVVPIDRAGPVDSNHDTVPYHC